MLALAIFLAAADCTAPFADPDEALTFNLRLSRSDWDIVRSAPMQGLGCAADYPYVHADFVCGDDTSDAADWLTIGLRQKRGEQRAIVAPEKPSLKLDFNHVVNGQRWPAAAKDLGFRKLSMNNGQASLPGGVLPALLGENVAWRVLREALPVSSRAVYARLSVTFTDDASTSYHGVYLLVEDIDRTQVRARLGADCGALLKATDSDCGEEVEYDDGPPNTARTAYDAWLRAPATGNAPLDVAGLLRQEAARIVIGGQHDTPTGVLANNYYRVEPRAGTVQFFPWDLDNSFGAYPRPISAAETIDEPCSAIGDRTRCDPATHAQYLAQVCDLIQGAASAQRLVETWQHTDSVVRPLLAAERDVVWNGKDPLDAATAGTYASEYNRVLAWIPAHIAAVHAQLASENFYCAASCEAGTTRACAVSSCGGLQTCSAGAWTACAVSPQPEICNGIDDNCDGIIDEGCKLPKQACPTATPLPRAPTVHGCRSTGAPLWAALFCVFLWRGRSSLFALASHLPVRNVRK